ncbi:Cochaperone protein [Dimargaris xerosporica]|nr:Cochaperone protein [Dimargaris xerosporica]
MTQPKYEWYQNGQRVYVSVFIKNLRPDDVQVDIQPQSLSVHINRPEQTTFVLDFDPLSHEVDVAQSGYELLATKVEIRLHKKVPGYQWQQLEGTETLPTAVLATTAPANPSTTDRAPVYPTSSRKTHDWDQLARDAENDDFDKPDGDRALDKMFQQIYKDADDDTRRAMMKSFIESNGTCLSTNWNEVGKGKVETKAPEGMEAKPY